MRCPILLKSVKEREDIIAMATDMRPIWASEAGSAFKEDICLYICVTKRNLKKDEPNMMLSKTSSVNVNLLNTKTSRGVNYYLESTIPAYILEKTKSIMSTYSVSPEKKGGNDAGPGTTPAYTTKIAFGKFKGMTPIEVLAKFGNEAGKDLNSTYQMLAQNAADPTKAKYRANNEKQMAAIAEASRLSQEGKISQGDFYEKIPIWPTRGNLGRGVRTPDNKKLDARGLTLARSISMTYDTNPTNTEPYHIEIMNCMAPPVPGAKVGAYLKQAVDKEVFAMDFPEDVWYGLWRDVVDAKGAFSRTVEAERVAYNEANSWKPQDTTQGYSNNVVPYQQNQQPVYGQQQNRWQNQQNQNQFNGWGNNSRQYGS